MNNTTAISKETQQQIDSTEKYLAEAQAYAITTDQQYAGTADRLKEVKRLINDLDTARKKVTKPLDEAKKALMDLFKPATDRLDAAERFYKNKMMDYQRELDRKAAAAQALLDEQARKDREKLEKKAEKAAAKGDIEKADDLQAQAATTVAPVVNAAKPNVAGVNTVTRWKYKIVNASLIPREYMIPNDAILKSLATSSKGSLQVPGVEFYPETDIAASRK